MKSLIITSHPSPKWFTHKIAEYYKNWREDSWNEAEIINLYTDDYKQDYLRFMDYKNPDPDTKRDIIQEKIRKANEIVLVHPLWWDDAPAILKNFIDTNFLPWFWFKFESWKSIPTPLLTEKKWKIFVTCDWPMPFQKFISPPIKKIWKTWILEKCWIDVVEYNILDRMSKKNDDELTEYLSFVYKSWTK